MPAPRRPPPPSLPAWPLSNAPRRRHGDAEPPRPLYHSPRGPPLLCFLSLTRPNAAIATDAVRRGHRPPLALPLGSGAPPRPPLPPHRSTALRKPCSVVFKLIFNLRPPSTSSSIRRRSCFPELPEATVATPVSSPSISPPPRTRSRTLAARFTGAVSSSPPAMSQTALEPP